MKQLYKVHVLLSIYIRKIMEEINYYIKVLLYSIGFFSSSLIIATFLWGALETLQLTTPLSFLFNKILIYLNPTTLHVVAFCSGVLIFWDWIKYKQLKEQKNIIVDSFTLISFFLVLIVSYFAYEQGYVEQLVTMGLILYVSSYLMRKELDREHWLDQASELSADRLTDETPSNTTEHLSEESTKRLLIG